MATYWAFLKTEALTDPEPRALNTQLPIMLSAIKQHPTNLAQSPH